MAKKVVKKITKKIAKKAKKKTPKARKKKSLKKTAASSTGKTAGDVASEVNAPFVLVVQILAQGAATMDDVPIDGGTFVVGVMQTLASTDAVGDLSGFEITVQHSPADLKLGAEYVVHAQSWLYGDGIALLATNVVPYSDDIAQAATEQLQASPMVSAMSRVAESELVVSGQVVSLVAVKAKSNDPVTEHDPRWCEAVVDVDTVEHAADNSTPARVTVRFAASVDVEWAGAPKVDIGDRRVFMLGNTENRAAAASRAISGAKTNQYSLVNSSDVLPIEALEDLRLLMHGGDE